MIEAAENLARAGVTVDEVVDVGVRCHPLVQELTGVAVQATPLQARFSTAHAVAVGLLTGALKSDAYTAQRIIDPEVVRLRDLVRLRVDNDCAREEAQVTVHLADGRTVSETVLECKGSPGRQLSRDDVYAKARDLVEPVLPHHTDALIAAIEALPQAPNLTQLTDAMCPR